MADMLEDPRVKKTVDAFIEAVRREDNLFLGRGRNVSYSFYPTYMIYVGDDEGIYGGANKGPLGVAGPVVQIQFIKDTKERILLRIPPTLSNTTGDLWREELPRGEVVFQKLEKIAEDLGTFIPKDSKTNDHIDWMNFKGSIKVYQVNSEVYEPVPIDSG